MIEYFCNILEFILLLCELCNIMLDVGSYNHHLGIFHSLMDSFIYSSWSSLKKLDLSIENNVYRKCNSNFLLCQEAINNEFNHYLWISIFRGYLRKLWKGVVSLRPNLVLNYTKLYSSVVLNIFTLTHLSDKTHPTRHTWPLEAVLLSWRKESHLS